MATTAATPSLRRVNQALPGPGGGGGGGGNGRSASSTRGGGTTTTNAAAPPSLVESLMRESADGIDVSSRLPELKRAILTDGITADDMGMSSHRIYIWLVLLRTPVLSYDTYAALLKRGASPAYAKINDDTHRTLATDPLFARRVSQNSIARLLNTIAWALDDANKLRREAATTRHGVEDVQEPPKVVAAANVEGAETTSDAVQTQAPAPAPAPATAVTEPSAAQITNGMAALILRAEAAAGSSSAAVPAGPSGTGLPVASTADRSSMIPASTPAATTTSNGVVGDASVPVPATNSLPSTSTASTTTTAPSSILPATSTPATITNATTTPLPNTTSQSIPSTAVPTALSTTPTSMTALALPAPYVQGMNVLAAPFLYVSRSEPQAHAGLYSLLARHLPAYITPTMSGVHAGLDLVDRLLALLDPALAAHLAARGLTASVYAFPAVLTLSACTPPLPEVLRLWDFLLSWGVHLNLLAVVAQVHLLRTKLLKSDSPMKELRASLGPLRARRVQELVIAFVSRVPEGLWREMVAHTGGGGGDDDGGGN